MQNMLKIQHFKATNFNQLYLYWYYIKKWKKSMHFKHAKHAEISGCIELNSFGISNSRQSPTSPTVFLFTYPEMFPFFKWIFF